MSSIIETAIVTGLSFLPVLILVLLFQRLFGRRKPDTSDAPEPKPKRSKSGYWD